MDVNVNLSLFYVLFCFLLILFVAKKTLFAKLDEILGERRTLIEGAKEASQGSDEYIETSMAEMNEKLSAARSDAYARRLEMKEEASNEQKRIVDQARDNATQKVEAAGKEIDSAMADARTQLEADSKEMAKEIVAKILGRIA